ncbi:MAG: hypothetical protein US22_C0001G0016 [candidate division TM6 bacterium GW2011_GWF2_36_6]|nr:MAG: hypothetical protein US22_C0001G0016 [candidate division TM6 bacterium GW2011_GWF2_36_6]
MYCYNGNVSIVCYRNIKELVMKIYVLSVGLIGIFFPALMSMQSVENTMCYDQISVNTVQIPDFFSSQSKDFFQVHVLFAQLEEFWAEISDLECKRNGQQLQNILSTACLDLRHEALSVLVNLFLYHRPFNLSKAIDNINALCVASPFLVETMEYYVEKKGVIKELCGDLYPHQKLILYVLAHNESLAHLMNRDFIKIATSYEIIEKLLIAFNLVKMNTRYDPLYFHRIIKYDNEYAVMLEIIVSLMQNQTKMPNLQYFLPLFMADSFEVEKIFFNDDLDACINYFSCISSEDYNPFVRWHLMHKEFVAALAGAPKVFKYLLLTQSTDVVNSDNNELVRYAICGNNHEIIHLCEQYYSYTYSDEQRAALFMESIRWHRAALMNYLKEQGSLDYGNFLCDAVFFRNIPYFLWYISMSLVDNNQNIERAFCNVDAHDNLLFAQVFLEMNIDVNCSLAECKTTPLFEAIQSENVSLVNFLLTHGASAFVMPNNIGVWHEIAKLINGQNMTDKMGMGRIAILPFSETIAEKISNYHDQVIYPLCELLDRAGAPLGMQDPQGNTIFHYLVLIFGDENLLNFLLRLKNISYDDALLKIPNNEGVMVSDVLKRARRLGYF